MSHGIRHHEGLLIQLESTEQMLTITWQDRAPGVGPAEIGRLFDRLYRVESSRTVLWDVGIGIGHLRRVLFFTLIREAPFLFALSCCKLFKRYI